MRKILGYTLWLAGLLFFFSNAWAERQVTDQLGRTVTIPDHVNRVVVLQHQTLNLLVQLDAQNSIVGILSSWKNNSANTMFAWLHVWWICPCLAI